MIGFIARTLGLGVGALDKALSGRAHGGTCLRSIAAAAFLGGGLQSMSAPSGDHRAAFLNAQNAQAAMVSSAPRAAPPPPRT